MSKKGSCCYRNTHLDQEEVIAADGESVGGHPFLYNAVPSLTAQCGVPRGSQGTARNGSPVGGVTDRSIGPHPRHPNQFLSYIVYMEDSVTHHDQSMCPNHLSSHFKPQGAGEVWDWVLLGSG